MATPSSAGAMRARTVTALLAAVVALATSKPLPEGSDVLLQPAPIVPEDRVEGLGRRKPTKAEELVRRLNNQYLRGKPSAAVADAGVVIHQFDDSGFNTTTRVSKEGGVSFWDPWMPCPRGQWCGKFADRFSTSLLNDNAPYAFNEHNGGFIIASDTAQKGALCSWATDARSMRAARTCLPKGVTFKFNDPSQFYERRQDCVPGCLNGVPGQKEDLDTAYRGMLSPGWCDDKKNTSDSWCPWRPQHLKRMLEQQLRGKANDDCAQKNGCRYNELVVDSRAWVDDLPHTVLAIFEFKGQDDSSMARGMARRTHARFLEAFDLTDLDVPLLQLDLNYKRNGASGPFQERHNHLLRSLHLDAQAMTHL